MSSNPTIDVKGLSVTYDRKRVLANIYLSIEKGHIYGLIGPNGAGKSTLIKAILGIIEPNSGTVHFDGGGIEAYRQKIAYIPQKDDIDWDFPATVYDVVLMGRYPHKKVFQRINVKDEEIALEALKTLGIAALKERQIGTLSGGQQQRVFIARALCQEASILFMDEPFVGVDMTTEAAIVQIMKTLSSEGKTLVVVHHDLSTVDEYFDKVILLNQRLIAFGDTSSVFTRENIALTYASQMQILQQIGVIETGGLK